MSTNHRVLLVVNPISGGKDKTAIIQNVEKAMLEENGHLRIYHTSGENDKAKLEEIIEDFKPTRILTAGGDGTIKLIAEILKDDSIPLGIFPAGSANGLAENLNLPTDVKKLTKIALSNNFAQLDTIIVNNELCLHISDIGLNAALIKNYEEGNIRGKLGYLIQSIPTLIKTEFPFHFTIEKDGKTINKEAVLLGIANARKYGTGSTINPKGRYDDGLFEVLVFKEFNIPQILQTFRENVELSPDFIEILSASKIKITCTKKVPFQIDGEYRGEVNEVNAQISPIKVRIAVPEKNP
jgi:diacylglycerol kinase (ATP)